MKMTLLAADGTFRLSVLPSFPLMLSSHAPDPNDPLLFVPKFCQCKHRDNLCKMSDCGKRIMFHWHCNLFDKSVGYKTCEECNAEKS